MSKKWMLLIGVALITSLLAFSEDLFQISKNIDIFSSVYKELVVNYVDEINSSRIIKKGIDAMLDDLDPYTEFVPESDIEEYKMKYVSTQYGGIGASVFVRDGIITISEVYEGFPAQKNDIRAGDELLEVDGVKLSRKKDEDVSAMLKGPKGTKLKILIKRNNNNTPIEKIFNREEIKQNNVSYSSVLEQEIGYIKLDRFLENSAEEVKDALHQILKSKPKGLILDLRYNGGGILTEAVKIVNLFVAKNIEIVAQKGRNIENPIVYKTTKDPIAADIPLVVLINAHSASASEIVAGSLQDLDRAVLIGQRSFGKGLVQQTFNLPYNTLVKMTVAKYYLPSGRCIQSLDYSNKTNNGSANKMADSLMTEFKTQNKRFVYDGNGIYPDIVIKEKSLNEIIQFLVSNYLIFDYTNKYRQEHNTITQPDKFRISDELYLDFINYTFLKTNQTKSEKLLNDLKNEIDKNKKSEEFKSEYETLKIKLNNFKKQELTTYKSDIKKLLETEIIARYYFEKGRLQYRLKEDIEVNEASKIILNTTSLTEILSGANNHKYIGKPKKYKGELSAKNDED